MRVATWNVNSLKARLERVEEWIAYAQPDVLCLQETKLSEDAFPALTFSALGYDAVHHGSGRWNGVAILSKVGLDSVTTGFSDGVEEEAVECRAITATCGGVRITSVYVPNGRSLDSDHYQYKLNWLDRLLGMLERECSPSDPVIVCGDFNIAPEDRDVWNIKRFKNSTHVSQLERNALAKLQAWGLQDTFRLLYQDDELYTYWDYRAGDFHMHRGMRIDLLLASEPMARKVRWGLVDRNARKGKLPSDHAPLLIDFDD